MPTYLISFINNWLNQFSFSYEFLRPKSLNPKRSLMLRIQMIAILAFAILITNLDNSFVHVLNKQEK
jgi:hypothetical protein